MPPFRSRRGRPGPRLEQLHQELRLCFEILVQAARRGGELRHVVALDAFLVEAEHLREQRDRIVDRAQAQQLVVARFEALRGFLETVDVRASTTRASEAPLLEEPEAWPDDPEVLRWAALMCVRAGVSARAADFWSRVLATHG